MTEPKSLRHTPSTDAREARELLLWARKEGIAVTTITVGTVQMDVSDLRLATSLGPKNISMDTESAAKNLYAEYGGGLLEAAEKQAVDKGEESPDVEEDEDE